MHRVWGIDELVRSILMECSDPCKVALAQTCRSLFDLAADSIWKKQTSLTPITDLIPEGCLEDSVAEVEKVAKRIKLYASKVRSLRISELEEDLESMQDLLAICSSGVGISGFFTSLHRLAITVNTPEWLEYAARFSVPKLSYLRLDIVPDTDTGDLDMDNIPPGSDILELAKKMSMRKPPSLDFFWPSIQELHRMDSLHVYARDAPDDVLFRFLLDVTRRFSFVTELAMDVHPVSAISLLPVLCLTKLERLQLSLIQSENVGSGWHLPRLASLVVEIESSDPLLELIAGLCAPHLQSVYITTFGLTGSHPQGPGENFRQLSGMIAGKWPSLRDFFLDGMFSMDDQTAQHCWNFDTFRPLLACRSLLVMIVQTDYRVLITDDDLKDISVAWPFLKSLKLASACIPFANLTYVSQPPQATFKGLYTITMNCPNLLGLWFSVSLDGPDPFLEATETPAAFASPLVRLFVEDCPPCSADFAVPILRRLFPQMEFFTFARLNEVAMRDPASALLEEQRMTCMQDIARRVVRPSQANRALQEDAGGSQRSGAEIESFF